MSNDTHSLTAGYILWFFGFTGAHRFARGRYDFAFSWLLLTFLGMFGVVISRRIPPMTQEVPVLELRGVVTAFRTAFRTASHPISHPTDYAASFV